MHSRRRVSGAVINASEMCSLGGALVIMLSIIGINVSALLIPAGIALALAAKDLSHNFLAGFFLFAVQVRHPAAQSESVDAPPVFQACRWQLLLLRGRCS